jgi:hypothetical protein
MAIEAKKAERIAIRNTMSSPPVKDKKINFFWAFSIIGLLPAKTSKRRSGIAFSTYRPRSAPAVPFRDALRFEEP